MTMRQLALALALWLLAAVAHAEGSAQLPRQSLRRATVLFVDILGEGEAIRWTTSQSNASVTVRAPDGSPAAVLLSGQSFATSTLGRYQVDSNVDLVSGDWDITVLAGTAPRPGRLHSMAWHLDAGNFTNSSAANGSVYVVVAGGTATHRAVVEVQLDGYAGFTYRMLATPLGVGGRSAPVSDPLPNGELPIYLNLPEIPTRTFAPPSIAGASFSAGARECNIVVPGTFSGEFRFEAGVEGTYHIVCDTDRDGIFDRTNDADVFLLGAASAGANAVAWDGRRDQSDLAPGSYECAITTNVGEVHWIAEDIETSFEGFRMFGVDPSGSRSPLAMFWDDTAVGTGAVDMPYGGVGLLRSGPNGISSGPYTAAPRPSGTMSEGNARSWGNFMSSPPGDGTHLDTYGSLASASSAPFAVIVGSASADADGDGLATHVELCTLATDDTLADSDMDGHDDSVEAPGGSPVDTDSDGMIDALDPESDGDGVGDATDTARTDRFACADGDADGCDDCAIAASPMLAMDGPDADGDGACDTGDDDDDGDDVADVEDVDATDASRCRDSDADGCDDCAIASMAVPANDGSDLDGDGACDVGDDDDDGDDVPDPSDTDPLDAMRCADGDADGCDDCSIQGAPAVDNDGPDADGDGICDAGEMPLDAGVTDAGLTGDAGPSDAGPTRDDGGAADAGPTLDAGEALDAGTEPIPAGCACGIARQRPPASLLWLMGLLLAAALARRR